MFTATFNSKAAATPIRIVLADDHPIYRTGFEAMLKNHSSLLLVGQAGNGKELVEVVTATQPDVVITGIQMPVMDGIEATKIIRRQFPAIEVIGLSMSDGDAYILGMLEAGARGYLLKTTTEKEIVYAVQTVQAKGTYYCSVSSNKLVRLMVNSHFHPYKLTTQPQFTNKEIEIIQLICQEKCSKEIGGQLKISQRAVERTRERIQEKTGAKNMIGIVLYAIKHGMFSVE